MQFLRKYLNESSDYTGIEIVTAEYNVEKRLQ